MVQETEQVEAEAEIRRAETLHLLQLVEQVDQELIGQELFQVH
jgi:hypothetical protein